MSVSLRTARADQLRAVRVQNAKETLRALRSESVILLCSSTVEVWKTRTTEIWNYNGLFCKHLIGTGWPNEVLVYDKTKLVV
jgi:hypothetical protein